MRACLPLKPKLVLLRSGGVPLRGSPESEETEEAGGWTLTGVLVLLQMLPGTSGSPWGLSLCDMAVDAARGLLALRGCRSPWSSGDQGAEFVCPGGRRGAGDGAQAGSNLGGALRAPL